MLLTDSTCFETTSIIRAKIVSVYQGEYVFDRTLALSFLLRGRSWRAISLCALCTVQPFSLAGASLEMRRNVACVLASSNHSASHLVAVSIHCINVSQRLEENR